MAILLSGISISASLFYYANVLQNANKTRQAQLFMNLYDTYHSPEFRKKWHDLIRWEWKDLEEWRKKHGQKSEDLAAYTSMLSFFNGIGVLLHRKLINIEMVDDLLSVNIRGFWSLVKSNVYWTRETIDEPNLYYYAEYLYDEIMKKHNKIPDLNKLAYREN
jgi:hypothetical protein